MLPTSPLSSPPQILAFLPAFWLPYRPLDFLLESPTLRKQPYFKPSSLIATSKDLTNNLLKACSIAEAKDKEATRFISGRVDITAELIENRAYLKTLLKEESVSISNNESSGSNIDLDSDISVEAKETLSSD